DVETEGATIASFVGGSGPPLLLLHGYPQTHVAWHRIAPVLARDYTVVATDLRGYGDSRGPQHVDASAYSKRTMARDQLAVQVGEAGVALVTDRRDQLDRAVLIL
ncbi:alpha/beta fold hydrolase, partial [Acinetobacter baumannii]